MLFRIDTPRTFTESYTFLPRRYPFLLGAMQYAEASPADAPRIVASMLNFTTLANSMLHDNYTGVEEWGAARWQDYTLVLQW